MDCRRAPIIFFQVFLAVKRCELHHQALVPDFPNYQSESTFLILDNLSDINLNWS